jgi:hypothetical protein
MYLVIADQTINDAIRPFDDFPDGAGVELRNDPPGLRSPSNERQPESDERRPRMRSVASLAG